MVAPIRTDQATTGVAPQTVTGPTNAEGSSQAFARADHQHRLEVEVEDAGSSVGARPAINFIGATVTDDGPNERINVDVSGGSGALAGLPGNIYESLVGYIDAGDRNSYPGSGTTVTDLEGNATGGTLNGGADVSDGGFNFDANGESLTLTKGASLDNLFAGGGTVITFFRPVTQASSAVVISTQNVSDNAGWRIFCFLPANGRYAVRFEQTFTGSDGEWNTFNVEDVADPTPTNQFVTGARPVNIGEYTSVAAVYNSDNTANTPLLYVSGQQFRVGNGIDIDSNPSGVADDDSANEITIGNRPDGTIPLRGQFATALFFDRELTPEEVTQVQAAFFQYRYWGRNTTSAPGQSAILRGGNSTEVTGLARFGGNASILGGDVASTGNGAVGGEVYIRGGQASAGRLGRLTCLAGTGGRNSNLGAFDAEIGGGTLTGGNAGGQTLFRGSDNIATGSGGPTIVRGGDATAAGTANSNGGALSLRGGGFRTGVGGPPPSPGGAFMRPGGPLVSGAGGGETGDVEIYTGRDSRAGDPGPSYVGVGCNTGNILLSTEGPGPQGGTTGNISAICGDVPTTATGSIDPGDVTIQAGDMLQTSVSVNGGAVLIEAGDSDADANGDGGDVNINAGDQTNTAQTGGRGGDVFATAGDVLDLNETGGRGGDVQALAGRGSAGRPGEVRLLTDRFGGSTGGGVIAHRTGGFVGSRVNEGTIGVQQGVPAGGSTVITELPDVLNDGDGVQVTLHFHSIDPATQNNAVHTIIEQAFYRIGGNLFLMPANRNNRVGVGPGWGTDGNVQLAVSPLGPRPRINLINGGIVGYPLISIALDIRWQQVVQS